MWSALTVWLRPLAAPEDRVLLALVVLVVGYVVLGAVVARRTPGQGHGQGHG